MLSGVCGAKSGADATPSSPSETLPRGVLPLFPGHPPNGLRLVQVDPDFDVVRVERGRPVVHSFDAEAWNSIGVRPSHPVSALFTLGAVTLPSLRYVCKPDVLAFVGSERVDA